MNRATFLLGFLLVLLCVLVYWQTSDFEFVNFDDDRYIINNPMVVRGLTVEGVKWAFATTYAANWHPLTWISHMVDCSLFGLNPGRHHQVNVVIHAANTLLLFLVLVGMFGLPWRSAVVAGLFAVHPLHVESVAWISERKDLLSAFFWFLTLLAYERYVHFRNIWRYLLVCCTYVLGLLCKPMLVSLPLILILLDYWPLRRIINPREKSKGSRQSHGHLKTARVCGTVSTRGLLLEKVPLFVLSAASCVVTVIAQRSGGAIVSAEMYPIGVRVANAVVSYVLYLIRMFWPFNLACFYPHPGSGLPVWQVVLSFAALGFLTTAAVTKARRVPYLAVSWFWYLITLVPVIGLIQVGRQASADRYTYIPLVGIFIGIVWAIAGIVERERRRVVVSATLTFFVLGGLAALSFRQTQHWRDSVSLFSRAATVTKNNGLAYYNLGCALHEAGESVKAREYIRKALDLLPGDALHYNSYGCDLLEQGVVDMAIVAFQRAIRSDPRFRLAYINLAAAYVRAGEKQQALQILRQALTVNPNDYETIEYLKKIESGNLAQ